MCPPPHPPEAAGHTRPSELIIERLAHVLRVKALEERELQALASALSSLRAGYPSSTKPLPPALPVRRP